MGENRRYTCTVPLTPTPAVRSNYHNIKTSTQLFIYTLLILLLSLRLIDCLRYLRKRQQRGQNILPRLETINCKDIIKWDFINSISFKHIFSISELIGITYLLPCIILQCCTRFLLLFDHQAVPFDETILKLMIVWSLTIMVQPESGPQSALVYQQFHPARWAMHIEAA